MLFLEFSFDTMFLISQVLGGKMRGKNLHIALTYLSGLTTLIIRTLRMCKFFKFPFRVSSVLQMLSSKTRGKNLHITLTYLSGLTTVVIETLMV